HGRTAYDLGEADAMRFAPIFNSVGHLMARAPEILGTHYEIAYPARQLSTARDLRALPLDAEYRNAAAHMGQVYGFERPLYFGKTAEPKMTFGRPNWHDAVAAEVDAATNRAAIFDASSFGKIDVTGPDAEVFLLHTCAGYLGRKPGSVIYTAILSDRGTFLSDITAQRIGEDHYRLFVGTNAIKRDLAHFRRASAGFDVTLDDTTETYAVLCLMGPDAGRIASECGAPELNDLGYFEVGPAHVAGKHVRAARLSYVGEAGWEITCKAENAKPIYAALTAAGAVPAGLFAQTSMRIEKGFCAMGYELDSDVTPIDTGLDFATRKTGGFVGADALSRSRAEGAKPRIVSLKFADRAAVPIGHEPVYGGDTIIGQTTSASYGHRVNRPVALALLNASVNGGLDVEVDIAGTRHRAEAVLGPLFDPNGTRMRA
ncbi:MAG: glycine cleavage T C-terminal barrel domain-containing protein, partial [Pseudomonadota bacterium]